MSPSPLPDAFRVFPLLLVAWRVMITSLFMDLFSYIVGTLKTFSISTSMSFRYGEFSWIMSLILFSPPYSLFPIYGTLIWLLADLDSSLNFIIFSLLFSTSLLLVFYFLSDFLHSPPPLLFIFSFCCQTLKFQRLFLFSLPLLHLPVHEYPFSGDQPVTAPCCCCCGDFFFLLPWLLIPKLLLVLFLCFCLCLWY